MSSRRIHARRIAGFTFAPLLGAVTPLLAMPAIASSHGAAGWAAVAVGQSVGAGASVAVELGWSMTGSQRVAAERQESRKETFVLAMLSKLVVFSAALPIAGCLALALGTKYPLACLLACVAITMNGLTANWYFIGVGRPRDLLLTDSTPRLIATVLGSTFLLLGCELWVFSAFTVVGAAASLWLACRFVGDRLPWREHRSVGVAWSAVREQRVAVTGRGFSALYISLPVSIVQAVAPKAVPAFAAAERLMRMGLLVIQSVPNSLQNFIGTASDEGDLSAKSRIVVLSQVLLGLFAGLTAAILLPYAVPLVFRGATHTSGWAAALAGGVVLFTCVSRGTGLVLVARDQVLCVTVSALTGALVGTIGVLVLSHRFGAEGAFAGLVLAEFVVVAVQLVWLIRLGACRRSVASSAPSLE